MLRFLRSTFSTSDDEQRAPLSSFPRLSFQYSWLRTSFGTLGGNSRFRLPSPRCTAEILCWIAATNQFRVETREAARLTVIPCKRRRCRIAAALSSCRVVHNGIYVYDDRDRPERERVCQARAQIRVRGCPGYTNTLARIVLAWRNAQRLWESKPVCLDWNPSKRLGWTMWLYTEGERERSCWRSVRLSLHSVCNCILSSLIVRHTLYRAPVDPGSVMNGNECIVRFARRAMNWSRCHARTRTPWSHYTVFSLRMSFIRTYLDILENIIEESTRRY